MRTTRFLIIGVLSGSMLVGAGVWFASGSISAIVDAIRDANDSPVGTDPSPVNFAVRPGSSARQVAEDLLRVGLIRSPAGFLALAERSRLDKDLQAGNYELRRTMSASEILRALASGAARRLDLVTIAEGWRAEEVALFLDGRGVISAEQFMEAVAGRTGTLPLPLGAPSFEGYLFPETYEFKPNSSPEDVLRVFLQQFEERVDGSLRAQAGAQGLSIQQLVTLASIIEREAVEPEERPQIAGVLHRRLDLGMPLEADPTVQYALIPFGLVSSAAGFWKAPLSGADLQVVSSYNTYAAPGLPPGPICSPGMASLRAAANPEPGPWLFFVARGDGSHLFSRTLDEHVANVARAGPVR